MVAKALDRALSRALAALRRPDAKLVRQHGGTTDGFYVCLPHDSFRVPNAVAAKLLECNDVQPFDLGLPAFGGRNPGGSATGANGRGEELIMAGHEPSIGLSSDWLTPKAIFSGLKLTCDLDPAHPGWENPYCVVPTRRIYTVDHDGLRQPWCGTLWMNPHLAAGGGKCLG